MTDRDDLAAIIGRNIPDGSDLKAADAILAAGWRKPRITEAECEAQHGHEFDESCQICGVEAREYFDR